MITANAYAHSKLPRRRVTISGGSKLSGSVAKTDIVDLLNYTLVLGSSIFGHIVISFKGRHHQQDIILQCVRWYVAYSLSYRDLEELMQERGYAVDHSTIQRWVVHYAPRIEKAFRKNNTCKTGRDHIRQSDHRFIKRRTRPMLGFKSFWSARATLAGIELWHMLKKGQNKSLLPAWQQFYELAVAG